jgi:hypothetical protein
VNRETQIMVLEISKNLFGLALYVQARLHIEGCVNENLIHVSVD